MRVDRAQRLRAMGINPYVLRRQQPAAVRCCVVLPAELDDRLRGVLESALRWLCGDLGTVRWVVAGASLPLTPATTRAWLCFGPTAETAIAALRSVEPAPVVAGAGEPAAVLSAAGKRRLWQALKKLKSVLAENEA